MRSVGAATRAAAERTRARAGRTSRKATKRGTKRLRAAVAMACRRSSWRHTSITLSAGVLICRARRAVKRERGREGRRSPQYFCSDAKEDELAANVEVRRADRRAKDERVVHVVFDAALAAERDQRDLEERPARHEGPHERGLGGSEAAGRVRVFAARGMRGSRARIGRAGARVRGRWRECSTWWHRICFCDYRLGANILGFDPLL